MEPTILFLCPHNAAKSVMAAAYCQHLAYERGLALRVTSAGTEPDTAVSELVLSRLGEQGFDVSDHIPRLVTAAELASASHIISLGCTLSELPGSANNVESWDTVPPPSRQFDEAWAIIQVQVRGLLATLYPDASP